MFSHALTEGFERGFMKSGLGPEEQLWEAVLSKDAASDGRFVFAVKSTMIYCKPSCPSRRAARERVQFFELPVQAEAEGYRACLRSKPRDVSVKSPQVIMVERACRLLEQDSDS